MNIKADVKMGIRRYESLAVALAVALVVAMAEVTEVMVTIIAGE